MDQTYESLKALVQDFGGSVNTKLNELNLPLNEEKRNEAFTQLHDIASDLRKILEKVEQSAQQT